MCISINDVSEMNDEDDISNYKQVPDNSKELVLLRWGSWMTNVTSDKVEKVNDILEKRGYNFRLIFINEDYDFNGNYNKYVEIQSSDEALDIANLIDSAGGYIGTKLFYNNHMACLDDFFEKGIGIELMDFFDEIRWSSTSYNGKRYAVPNVIPFNYNNVVVMNGDYFDFIESYKNLKEIDDLLESISINNNISLPIFFYHSIISGLSNYGYKDVDFVLFNNEGEPFYWVDVPEIEEYLNIIKNWYEKNWLPKDFSLKMTYPNEFLRYNSDIIVNKEYLVMIGFTADDLFEYDDDILLDNFYFDIPNKQVLQCNSCAFITQESKNKEEALKLLTLAYTDPEISRLLILGENNSDYIINSDGLIKFLNKNSNRENNQRYLGMYKFMPQVWLKNESIISESEIECYLGEKENFFIYPGRRFDIYPSKAKYNEMIKLINEYADIWQEDDINIALQNVRDELLERGFYEILDVLKNQLKNEYPEITSSWCK